MTNYTRALFLSNTAEERIESLGLHSRIKSDFGAILVYAVRFKNVSESWRQCEARANPSALERRLEWRAIQPPRRDREMRVPR